MATRKRTRRAPHVKTSPEKSVVAHHRTRKGKCKTSRRTASKPDVDAILERLGEAFSIIATATHAFVYAQDPVGSTTPHDIGDTVATLEHGVNALRTVCDELDVACRELRA